MTNCKWRENSIGILKCRPCTEIRKGNLPSRQSGVASHAINSPEKHGEAMLRHVQLTYRKGAKKADGEIWTYSVKRNKIAPNKISSTRN
jgi:hypothetical protein